MYFWFFFSHLQIIAVVSIQFSSNPYKCYNFFTNIHQIKWIYIDFSLSLRLHAIIFLSLSIHKSVFYMHSITTTKIYIYIYICYLVWIIAFKIFLFLLNSHSMKYIHTAYNLLFLSINLDIRVLREQINKNNSDFLLLFYDSMLHLLYKII